MWIWYLNKKQPDKLTHINIRIFCYQIGWNLENETTKVSFCSSDLPKTLIEFPYMLHFQLTENNINDKIKTILNFL